MTHFRSAALLSLTLMLAACGTVAPTPRGTSGVQTRTVHAQPDLAAPVTAFSSAPARSAAGSLVSHNTVSDTSTPGGATMSVNTRTLPLPNPAEAFTFLSPLQPSIAVNPAWADSSILSQLTVRLCVVSGGTCRPLSIISSRSAGSYGLKFDSRTGQYHTTLSLKDTGLAPGSVLRVQVAMASLLLGQQDLTLLSNGNVRTTGGALLSVNSNRSIPITFYVKNHFTIRAFSLADKKATATQIAATLQREFLAPSAPAAGTTTGRTALRQDALMVRTAGSVEAMGTGANSLSSLPPVDATVPALGSVGSATFGSAPATATSLAASLAAIPASRVDTEVLLVQVIVAMRATEYSSTETATALRDTTALREKQQAIAEKLAAAGYNAGEVGQGLKDTYPTSSPTDIAGFLRIVEFGVTDVALTLRDVFASTPAVATGILNSVGFYTLGDSTTWQTAGTVLRDVFSSTAVDTVKILQGLDVLNIGSTTTWTNLGNTLKSVFGQSADQALATLKSADVLNLGNAATWTGLGTMLKTSFGQGADAAVGTLKATFDSFASSLGPVAQEAAWQALGGMLKTVFAQSADQTWSVIKQSGLTIADPQMWASVGTMFEVTFGSTAAEGAAILKNLGASFGTIGPVLKDVFGSTATQAASIINGLGADFDQVGSVLKDTFNSTATATASIIKGLGATFDDIGSVLNDTFNTTAAETASIVYGLGATFDQVGSVLNNTFDATATQAASILKGLKADLKAVAKTLKNVFKSTAQDAASIVKGLGGTFEDVGSVLKDVFGSTASQAATIIYGLGATFEDVGSVLNDTFNITASQAASIIKDLGATFDDIGSVLNSAFGQTATQVANTLNSIGATANDIAGVLKDTFNWSVADVGNYLKNTLGLAENAVATALGYAGYAADAISSWVGDAWDTIKDGFCSVFGC